MNSRTTFSSPLGSLEYLPAPARDALGAAGFSTAGDLLLHVPRRHEDRRRFHRFPTDELEAAVCLHGRVTDTARRGAGRRRFFEATLEEAEPTALSNPLVCRWFHMPWMHKVVAVGHEIVVFGRPKRSGPRLVLDHPDFEIVEQGGKAREIHLGRLTPVYPLRDGLRQHAVREALFDLVAQFDWGSVPDLLPEPSTGGAFAGMGRARALREIHFPDNEETLDSARRYLALEEFFALQLNVLTRKRAYAARAGAAHCGPGDLLERFLGTLPFAPTGAQRRAFGEVRTDLASTAPMHRLLQGDVGSGKTLVAAAAILLAVEAGFQAALMAPTQILAEQHFLSFQGWLGPLGVGVALHTSDRRETGDPLPLFSGGAGGGVPQVVIGTHALLYGAVEFENLGLVVIDEQHKFGVAQRGKLVGRGVLPDVLVMTATPIPRTLTMTVYGDLDVSVLDELPPGRGTVVTAVRPGAKVADVAGFLRTQLDAGRQAYIVYPLVDESETLAAEAATTGYEAWRKRLAPHVCGLLHGRLRPDEKDAVMGAFRAGEVAALVATTVVEVGVDVPNATVMVVYNAERFGLAQLHQLRGRIGRGAHRSYCVLVPGPKNKGSVRKLDVLAETSDGFRVAEADLALRGPGDVLGTAQSGLPCLRFGDLLTDASLVRLARKLATAVIDTDPDLRAPEHQPLRPLVAPDEPGLVA